MTPRVAASKIVAACFANRWSLRFVRQDVYRSRLSRLIGNGDQCALLVSLALACAVESKSTPIVVSLLGATGTRSKRNFHRPESNCGMALNSGCRVFIVLQSRRRLQIRARRQSTDSGPQTRKKCSNLNFQESDFSSCHFLKRLKTDISRNGNVVRVLSAARNDSSAMFVLKTAAILFRCDRREPLHDRREARITAQRIP